MPLRQTKPIQTVIIGSERDSMKTAAELTVELNYSRHQPVSNSTVKNQLRSLELSGCIAIKKLMSRKMNKQKRLLGKKAKLDIE